MPPPSYDKLETAANALEMLADDLRANPEADDELLLRANALEEVAAFLDDVRAFKRSGASEVALIQGEALTASRRARAPR